MVLKWEKDWTDMWAAEVGSFTLIVQKRIDLFEGVDRGWFGYIGDSEEQIISTKYYPTAEEAQEAIEELANKEFENALSVFAGHCGCEGGEFACDGRKHKE